MARVTDFACQILEDRLQLEVSTQKSAVTGSDVRTIRMAAAFSRRRCLRPAYAAKMLGAAVGGGRRRSVIASRNRLNAFRRRLARLRAFRRLGGNTPMYCRVAGIPALVYGIDAQGVADTRLHEMRVAVMHAACPDTYGRNVDAAFHVLDAAGTATDPAVEVHALLVVRWATALWECWVPRGFIDDAFQSTRAKADSSGGVPPWQSVAGPVAAYIATLHRIGWMVDDAANLRDDMGVKWNLMQHSPAAVKQAVGRSVRRWRLGRLCTELPGLIDGVACTAGSTLVDLTRHVAPLLVGSVSSHAEAPLWEPKCRADLASAMAGGQWPQARRAAARTWHADNRCQLCLTEVGTLAHRRVCTATMPRDGWTLHGPEAAAYVARLAPGRALLLQTRALLVERVPLPVRVEAPRVRWVTEPPDPVRADLRWFTDGSLVDACWDGLAVAAAALNSKHENEAHATIPKTKSKQHQRSTNGKPYGWGIRVLIIVARKKRSVRVCLSLSRSPLP